MFFNIANMDASDPVNWQDDVGTGLESFDIPYVMYSIQNDITLNNNWQINGKNSKLIVDNGNRAILTNNNNVVIQKLELTNNGMLDMVSDVNNTGDITVKDTITIKTGSVFNINAHNLYLTNDACINPDQDLGEMSTNGGSLHFQSSSTANSYLYFSNEHSIFNFDIDIPDNSFIYLENAVELANTLKLTSGHLNTGDNLVFLSDEDGTARLSKVGANGILTGKITFQRYVGPNKISGWYNLGINVKNQTLSDWSSSFTVDGPWNDGYPNIRTYNESKDRWESVLNDNLGLIPGKGYQIYIYDSDINNGSFTFTNAGEPFIGNGNSPQADYQIALTKQGSLDNGGWNLVSNPYPCELDWNSLNGWGKQDIIDSYYVWDNTTKSYGSYSTGLGTGCLSGSNGIIPSGQSFFVYAVNNGTLNINENAKDASESNPTVFRTSAHDMEYLRIFFTTGQDGFSDETIIAQNPGASEGFDRDFDAKKLMNPNINIYSKSSDQIPLAINSLSFSQKTGKIPLLTSFVKTTENDSCQLSFERHTSEDNIEYFLIDSLKSKRLRITNGLTYKFKVKDKDNPDTNNRFYILVNQGDVKTNHDLISGDKNVIIYPNPFDREFNIAVRNFDQGNGKNCKLLIYNSIGVIIYDRDFDLTNRTKVVINSSDLNVKNKEELLFYSISVDGVKIGSGKLLRKK